MKYKLTHPLWVHLPALAALLGALALAKAGPATWLSSCKYGTARTRGLGGDVIEVMLTGLLGIGISVLIDELWARQESRKTFNWLSLIDEAVVGVIAGTLIPSAKHLALWALPVGAVAAATVLELLRPYRPTEQHVVHEDTSALERHIQELKQQGKAWVYWDVQNPWWMAAIIVESGAALLCAGIATLRQVPWLAGLMMVTAVFMFSLWGGLRTSVTSDKIDVRMGVLRLLRLRIADIASADVHAFSPLREFGGYGIRISLGKGIRAYFLRGNRGVLVTATSGKKYLIGSHHPERLAAAINATVAQHIR